MIHAFKRVNVLKNAKIKTTKLWTFADDVQILAFHQLKAHTLFATFAVAVVVGFLCSEFWRGNLTGHNFVTPKINGILLTLAAIFIFLPFLPFVVCNNFPIFFFLSSVNWFLLQCNKLGFTIASLRAQSLILIVPPIKFLCDFRCERFVF